MPPSVQYLFDGPGDSGIIAHVGATAVVERLCADPMVGSDDDRHMARFASVTEGARVLKVATSSEQCSNIAGRTPVKKVDRPTVTKSTSGAFTDARGVGNNSTLSAPLALAGRKVVRVSRQGPKPVLIDDGIATM